MDAGHEIEGGMANSPSVSSTFAFAIKLIRVLLADATMFARVRGASISHVTRFQNDVISRADLLVFPIRWELVISVDGDVSHTTDEPSGAVNATSNHVIRAGGNI